MSKSDANALIQSVVAYIMAAAETLQNSKFSDTAINRRFRPAVTGQLRTASKRLVEMAWVDGNGSGDIPYDIASQYLDEQFGFLENWLADVAQEMKLVGGVGRAAMYGESLGQCYQRAYMRARGSRVGLPDLPAYPRDGSTVCLVHCRCQWKIKKLSDTFFEATWKLGAAEHCPDCIVRGRDWNPLSIVRQMGRNANGVLELGDWVMTDLSGRVVQQTSA